jgi:hypothetical protein
VIPPAIVIRLELEAAPRVYCEALAEAEQTRLGDWLAEARPEYGALVDRAMELEAEERAA